MHQHILVFRGTYCLHLQAAHFNPEEGGDTFPKNAGSHLHDITTQKTFLLPQILDISGVIMDWHTSKKTFCVDPNIKLNRSEY
jgi:hypothetical protein